MEGGEGGREGVRDRETDTQTERKKKREKRKTWKLTRKTCFEILLQRPQNSRKLSASSSPVVSKTQAFLDVTKINVISTISYSGDKPGRSSERERALYTYTADGIHAAAELP